MFEKKNPEQYQKYLKSFHWIQLRMKIRKVRKNCEACHSGVGLEVHHKSYRHLGCELPTDLVLLCGHCHERVHFEQQTRMLTIFEATNYVLADERNKYVKGTVEILPPKTKWETLQGGWKSNNKKILKNKTKNQSKHSLRAEIQQLKEENIALKKRIFEFENKNGVQFYCPSFFATIHPPRVTGAFGNRATHPCALFSYTKHPVFQRGVPAISSVAG